MTPDTSSTCLIGDLDSPRQAELSRSTDGACSQAVTEAVRLGLLLCDQLALPRNQILDGHVILTLGPTGMTGLCGTSVGETLPLIALLETDDLGLDLVTLLRKLDTFHWSALDALGIGGDALQRVQLDLPEGIGPLEAISRLREATEHDPVAHAAACWLADRWTPWVDLAAKGHLQHQRWAPVGPITLDPPAHWHLDAALVQQWQTARRSDVLTQLASLEMSDDLKREVLAWWNDRYLQAIAEANGTFWLRVTHDDAPPTRRVDGSDRSLRLTDSARRDIRQMSSSVFSWVAYKCSRVQREWEDEPDAKALRQVAHVINRTSDPEDPISSQRSMLLRAALACIVAVAAAVLETTASTLAHGIGLTLIVIVLGGMAAVPYGELFRWWRERKTEMTAIVRRAE